MVSAAVRDELHTRRCQTSRSTLRSPPGDAKPAPSTSTMNPLCRTRWVSHGDGMSRHVASFALLLLPACPAHTIDDQRDDERDVNVDVDDDVVVDSGPCPAAPAGLALQETAPFLPGDDERAVDDGGDGVVVLMGGGAEVDRASARFVDGANGGDVLVLRASGSTSSYTEYFAEDLTASLVRAPRAVATLRLDDPASGNDDAVLCRVRRAEAIWLAGGDQTDYLVLWPAALHEALRAAIARGVAIGGTSAGAMSLSASAFDARGGGVTSAEALDSPLADIISVTPSPFSAVDGVIVDTHFSAREREGRLLVFMARAGVRGVGLDEETALVIDGDQAAVLADDGGAAFVYEGEGMSLTDGVDMARLARRTIRDGEQLAWPPLLDDAEVFSVQDGVLTPQP
jgi:cyanophycinase